MGPARDRPGDSDRPKDPLDPDADSRQSGDVFPVEGETSETSSVDRKSGEIDPRAHAAWRSWLGALASDPKAAMAAALAYESLSEPARDAWLEALDTDASAVRVPRVALYAPLLAVESDGARRARIEKALAEDVTTEGAPATWAAATHALRGVLLNGDTVAVVVSPLYLDFVELLVCRYGAHGITSARHEPLSHLRPIGEEDAIPEAEGAPLELAPLADIVEDLAHAVVADRRAGKEPPEALHRMIHLFAPMLSGRT
jgi:hypothetical protein